jgi:hypothetical protein
MSYAIFKGDTTETANKKSKDMMIMNMNKILQMEKQKEPGAIGWLKTLWTNYQSQILLGNNHAIF